MIEIKTKSQDQLTVYKAGDLFKVGDGDVYMLTQIEANIYKLISLRGGNRCSSKCIDTKERNLTFCNISDLAMEKLTPINSAELFV